MVNQLTSLVRRQAAKYGNREVFSHKDYSTNRWVSTSWNRFAEQVSDMAKAMVILGIREEENISTYTQNKPEGLIVDFAAFDNRAVTVPLYPTSSLDQIKYIIDEAEIRFLFVGGQVQYDNAIIALRECPTLEKLILFDPDIKRAESDSSSVYFEDLIAMGKSADEKVSEEVERRRNAGSPDDLATLIYTSGTTGEPKGVMLAHSNYDEAIRIHLQRLVTCSDKDVSLCFLPLTHVFERAWSYYCLTVGMRVAINVDPKDIQNTIREIRPTIMCSVPRFWEKVYSAIQDNLFKMKGVARRLAERAFVIGRRRNVEYLRAGKRVPLWLECQYRFYDKFVFSKIRRAVGVENGNIFPTAGAPLSDTINEFLHICGINIVYGYGLSETTATVSCFDLVGYEFGTVGSLMPDIQVKLGENNEILVKGKTVMKGYYRKPEETARVFTKDGWFRTGDAGKVNEQGALVLTERLKDLFKTSNGKYIAPQALETRLGEDKYIDQVAVIGDQRKYVTAIIIPAYEALKEYAAQKQIQYRNLEELVKNQKIQALISERIDALQKNFARFEQIKRFTLLPQAFSMEKGELTNTLKIRRSVINLLYKDEIEAMYA